MLGNLARPVSRGERGSDAPALPDCGIKLLGKEAIALAAALRAGRRYFL